MKTEKLNIEENHGIISYRWQSAKSVKTSKIAFFTSIAKKKSRLQCLPTEQRNNKHAKRLYFNNTENIAEILKELAEEAFLREKHWEKR